MRHYIWFCLKGYVFLAKMQNLRRRPSTLTLPIKVKWSLLIHIYVSITEHFWFALFNFENFNISCKHFQIWKLLMILRVQSTELIRASSVGRRTINCRWWLPSYNTEKITLSHSRSRVWRRVGALLPLQRLNFPPRPSPYTCRVTFKSCCHCCSMHPSFLYKLLSLFSS
jgi:hypothetical protein